MRRSRARFEFAVDSNSTCNWVRPGSPAADAYIEIYMANRTLALVTTVCNCLDHIDADHEHDRGYVHAKSGLESESTVEAASARGASSRIRSSLQHCKKTTP